MKLGRLCIAGTVALLFVACSGQDGESLVGAGAPAPDDGIDEVPVDDNPGGGDDIGGVDPQTCGDQAALRDLIQGIAPPALPTPKDVEVTEEETVTEVQDDTMMQCVYKRYEGTKLYETLVSFDPNADSLWPGAIVQTETLPQGLLAPIGLARRPGTVTLTNALNEGPEASLSRELDEPSLAAVQQAVGEILNSGTVNFAAKSNYDARQVYSLNEAAVKAGIAVEWMSGSVQASFGGTWTEHKTSYVVKFTQNYYTLSFAAPEAPEAVFDPCVTVDDAMPYMSAGNPPGYVASVSYGRMLLMKIESNGSSSDIEAALNAAFSAGTVDVDIDIDTQFKEVLRNAVVTVFALGGDPQAAVELMADADNRAENLATYLKEGAQFTPESPGVPIAYTVRRLSDNATIKVASTLDYQIPYCSAQSDHLMLELDAINVVDDGDDWPKGAGEITVKIYAQALSQASPPSGGAGECTTSGTSAPTGCGDLLVDAYYHADSGDIVNIYENANHAYLASRTNGEQFLVTVWAKEDDNDYAVLARNTHEFIINGNYGFWTNLGPNYIEDAADNLRIGLFYDLEVLPADPDPVP